MSHPQSQRGRLVLVAVALTVCCSAAAQDSNISPPPAPRVASKAFVPAVSSGTTPRTFVSSFGLDSNPCLRTSPCRNFAAAVAQTAPGGEVVALDSAGYGPVTLSTSITLVAPPGVYAGINVTTGNAVFISGTTASDVIVLRGLTIEGRGSGGTGISAGAFFQGQIIDVGALLVENCVVDGFDSGLSFATASPQSRLFVRDSTLRNCNNALHQIADVLDGAKSWSSIDGVRADHNTIGFWIDQSFAAISNSIASGNSGNGVLAQFAGNQVDVDHCVVTANGTGIQSNAGSQVRVSNTIISNNGTGLAGTNLLSRTTGDPANPVKTNSLVGNTTASAFTGTYGAQ